LENSLEEFIIDGIDRSELALMIYGANINKGKGISFSKEAPLERMHTPVKSKKPPCYECIKNGTYSFFVQEAGKAKDLNKSKSRNSESKVMIKSKPKTQESKVFKSSKPKAKMNSRPKMFKPKVLNDSKPRTLNPKVLKK